MATYETRSANRPGGYVFWSVAEVRNIGPMVFARRIGAMDNGRWDLVAITTNPRDYIRQTANGWDVVPAVDRPYVNDWARYGDRLDTPTMNRPNRPNGWTNRPNGTRPTTTLEALADQQH